MSTPSAISSISEAVLYAELAKTVNRFAGTRPADTHTLEVLGFISDRTFGYQKRSELIPVRHFLGGVESKKKGLTRAGLKMSAAKLYLCLRWLRDQGVVVTTKAGRKVRYAIRLEWIMSLVPPTIQAKIAPALNLVDDKWGTAEPRENLQQVEVSTPEHIHEVEVRLKNHSPYGVRKEERRSAPIVAPDAGPEFSSSPTEEKRASAPVEPYLAAAPAVAVQPSPPAAASSTLIRVVPVAPPTEKVAKRGRVPRKLWGSTLSDRFDAAFRKAWPAAELPAEASIKLKKQWEFVATHWRRTDIGPADWIEWCVKSWRTIYLTVVRHVEHTQEKEAACRAEAPEFRKRQWREDLNYPKHPDLGFLFAYRKAFMNEYDRRDSQMIRSGLLPGDRWLHELLLKGWPLEDAQREVAERLAKAKFREDLDARARQINEMARRLQAKEQDIDNRIALGKARLAMQPVSLQKHPVKPTFAYADEIGKPLPPLPIWRDEVAA